MSNPFDDLKADEPDASESEADAKLSEPEESEADAKSSEPEATTETGVDDDSGRTADGPSTGNPDPSTASAESVSDPSVDDSSEETGGESLSPAETGPAFEYSEVKQKPFYARTETVNEFENNIRTSIVPKLAEAGVLDEESREIHDAILRLANEQPERVAELVLEERKQSGDD